MISLKKNCIEIFWVVSETPEYFQVAKFSRFQVVFSLWLDYKSIQKTSKDSLNLLIIVGSSIMSDS